MKTVSKYCSTSLCCAISFIILCKLETGTNESIRENFYMNLFTVVLCGLCVSRYEMWFYRQIILSCLGPGLNTLFVTSLYLSIYLFIYLFIVKSCCVSSSVTTDYRDMIMLLYMTTKHASNVITSRIFCIFL